jgi:hypothetical protein
MAEMRRTLKCSGCGKENSFYMSSDMTMHEIVAFGKCDCGNSLQFNFNLITPPSASPSSSNSSSSSFDQALPAAPAIDENMMQQDFPSEAIKDLIDG